MQMSYWRFAAMIATSTLVMFGLMFIHTYVWDHAYFSETRAWMALLMGAVMAVIMLGYMLNMYKNRTVNIAIFAGAGLAFLLTTWLVRSQVTVSGIDYMQAMIPHHSIAILTSERAGIEDPRVPRSRSKSRPACGTRPGPSGDLYRDRSCMFARAIGWSSR